MDKSINDALIALNFKKVYEEIDHLKNVPITESIPGPKGDQGRPGRDGKDGNRGDKGAKGDKGDPGRDGINGVNGKDGRDGVDGRDGEKGDPGKDGRDGADGKDGAKGDPGKDGRNGIDGKDGRDGVDGKDGAKGEKGGKGDPGKDGVDGKGGRDGIDGKNGRDGVDGRDGKDGIDGRDGKDGAKGDQGERGEKGDRGDQGPPGKDAVVPDITSIVEKGIVKAQDDFNRWRSNVNKSLASIGGGGVGIKDVIAEIEKRKSVITIDSASLETITENILTSNISYNNLVDKPFIPSDVSQLTDSSGLLLSTGIDSAQISNLVDSAYIQSRQLTYNFLDSAEIVNLIDSAYIQARQTTYNFLDSAEVISLVDSDYVRTRQNFTYNSLTGKPTIPSDISQLTDSSGLLTTGGGGLDSAAVSSIIQSYGFLTTAIDSADVVAIVTSYNYTSYDSNDTLNLIDSAYIQSRQILQDFAYNSLTGKPNILDSAEVLAAVSQVGYLTYAIDSAVVTDLIDSSYIQLRQTPQNFAYGSLTGKPTIPSDISQLTDSSGLLLVGGGGLDSAAIVNLIDSNYVAARAPAGSTSPFSNQYALTATTSNSAETELLVNGSTRIPVATNKSVNYIVNIAARRTDTAGDYAMFEIRGVAANVAGTVTDIGSVYEVVVAKTNAGYLVDVRADDTNNSVNVYVTGVSGHTIDWKAVAQTIEV